MVAGVPARLKGWMCACGQKLNLTADIRSVERSTCTKCGRMYEKNETSVKQI
jgi:hypothetical protein